MSKKQETMQERIERLKKEKEQAQNKTNQTAIISQLAHEEETTADFDKITAEFIKLHENRQPGANEGYTKDTIYIKNSLYQAFNALCVNRGDKKKYVNQALEDFVLKKYKELKQNK